VRLFWLQACCAVAEGADIPVLRTVPESSSSPRCAPDVCVAAVLGDALHRVAVLGGRDGMPRSLGSVYGGSVTRFLGGGLRGIVSRVIDTRGLRSFSNGVAVSVDGSTLLVSDHLGGSHAIHELSVADGARLRVIGARGDGPLQFNAPAQVYIADDGFVFVADSRNNRVQVLTPSLDFHAFVGVGVLDRPLGVCADADVVLASEYAAGNPRISVFGRCDGALVRHIGGCGASTFDDHWQRQPEPSLSAPRGVCFTHGHRHVAVADSGRGRVSVFRVVDGEFVHHVGVGVLRSPWGVAVSSFDELVVADRRGHCCLHLFSAAGCLLRSFGRGDVTGVAIRGGVVLAQAHAVSCLVFE
jgi:hypothetical protein